MRPGEQVELFAPAAEQGPLPEPTVLFEDAALLALDKPPLLPTQGTLASDRANALGWARAHTRREVFSVHRLDLGTSGVLLVAKTAEAASALGAQLREGDVAKRYLALAFGRLPGESGSIELPLRKGATPGRYEVAPAGSGWPSRTDYRVLAARGETLFVEARPKTGRTHQIRVHLSHLGAPLLGDRRYRGPSSVAAPAGGALTAARPMLHAAGIRFAHPVSGTSMELEAPLPEDFVRALRELELELQPAATT
jgi:RluA family pseudouridine synthase